MRGAPMTTTRHSTDVRVALALAVTAVALAVCAAVELRGDASAGGTIDRGDRRRVSPAVAQSQIETREVAPTRVDLTSSRCVGTVDDSTGSDTPLWELSSDPADDTKLPVGVVVVSNGPYTLEGRVVAAEDDRPIAGATVDVAWQWG
jgi:hypothetical protein